MAKPESLIEVFYHGTGSPIRMGRLAPWRQGHVFEYDQDFVRLGIELSPVKLLLQSQPSYHENRRFYQLPGVFADALPDDWGMQILEKYFRRKFDAVPSSLERLAYVAANGIGALEFRPAIADGELSEQVNLIRLEEEARRHEADASGKVLEVLRQTTSVGGARPKALVSRDPQTGQFWSSVGLDSSWEHWLIKFQSAPDDEDPLIEHAYSRLAAACGIRVVETTLVESSGKNGELRHFAAKRFDLRKDKRIHFHSFMGLMEADYGSGRLSPDYESLILLAGQLTQQHSERLEMFRRAIFNVLTANGDDHAKNHGFLYENGQWTCSPAYDLTYRTMALHDERAMPVLGKGFGITRADFERLARATDIAEKESKTIIDQVMDGLQRWRSIAKATDISKETISEIANDIKKRIEQLSE